MTFKNSLAKYTRPNISLNQRYQKSNTTSKMLATITKMENKWDVSSIYELMYYHCPSCNYQIEQKQKFIDHACKSHPEVIENLKNITDGSLEDIIVPWDSKFEDFGNEISTEIADSAIDLIKIEEEDDLDTYNEISEKVDEEKCNEISKNITNRIPKHLQVSVLQTKKKSNLQPKSPYLGNSKKSLVMYFDCSSCKRQIPRTELKTHLDICRKSKTSQIKSKVQKISNPSEITSQVENRPFSEKISCEICGKMVHSLKKLEWHKANSHESCVCEKCGKPFENKKKLKFHDWRIHSEKKELQVLKCDECNWTTKRKYLLTLHKKGVHEGRKDEMCTHCGKTFLYKQALRLHVRTIHEGQRQKCKLCGKEMHGKLKRHMLTVHEGLKPYQCPHSNCNIAYGQNGDLKRHIQRVHFKNI